MKAAAIFLLLAWMSLGSVACDSGDDTPERAEGAQGAERAERAQGAGSPDHADAPPAAIVSETQNDPDAEQHLATCRSATVRLGGALKSALMEAMQEGGPVGALEVCQMEAGSIATAVGAEKGLQVGRTAVRVRNPANAPDSWEQAALATFAARIEAGEQPKDFEHWAVVTDTEGHRTFRYLKAIPTMSLCLKCHGDAIAPEVTTALTELYPDDQATGFARGDLRGAFTVRLPLEP
jgi:hypothetical protein